MNTPAELSVRELDDEFSNTSRVIFVNVQHPGEDTARADAATPPNTPATGRATRVMAPAATWPGRARPR
jgi:secreted PhoX family phosphatase